MEHDKFMFGKPGDKFRFLNANGYDFERQRARDLFEEGAVLTIRDADVQNFSSTFMFEEHPGRWFNTVMFKKVEEEVQP